MEKHRVLIICLMPLLCDGLQRILARLEDVEFSCLEFSDPKEVEVSLKDFHPGTVVVAGDKESDLSTRLITNLLKLCDDLPIVSIEMETNLLRVYTAHILPANSIELIDAIRHSEIQQK